MFTYEQLEEMDYREFCTWVKQARINELTREINDMVKLRNAMSMEGQNFSNLIYDLTMQIARLEGTYEEITQKNWEEFRQKTGG